LAAITALMSATMVPSAGAATTGTTITDREDDCSVTYTIDPPNAGKLPRSVTIWNDFDCSGPVRLGVLWRGKSSNWPSSCYTIQVGHGQTYLRPSNYWWEGDIRNC
jgi:hypothetical protein